MLFRYRSRRAGLHIGTMNGFKICYRDEFAFIMIQALPHDDITLPAPSAAASLQYNTIYATHITTIV